MKAKKQLTAQALIAKLSKLPPGTPIFQSGCEGGYDAVYSIFPDRFVPTKHLSKWMGAYDIAGPRQRKDVVNGVII